MPLGGVGSHDKKSLSQRKMLKCATKGNVNNADELKRIYITIENCI